MDRAIKVRRTCSKEQWEDLHRRTMSGELKGSALRKAEENILKEAEGVNRQTYKSLRKIKSLWKCIMKEAKKCQDPDTLSEEYLSVTGALLYLVRSDLISKFSFSLAHEELYPCPDSDTGEVQIEPS
jgi:F0F1-type ATP synthase gamma subunit